MTLKRKVDFDILQRIDDKTDTLVTSHAVICEQIKEDREKIKNHGIRLTWVERILYTAIGGGLVILFVLKVLLKT
jgi:hypothetical protein